MTDSGAARIRRDARVSWQGTLSDGAGHIVAAGGAAPGAGMTWAGRTAAESPGSPGTTSPEELIAAAHAGCFSMALAFQLQIAGFTPDELRTRAHLTLEQQGGGFAVTGIRLDLAARVPGIGEARFHELAAEAKANCPISKLLSAPITLDARLEQGAAQPV